MYLVHLFREVVDKIFVLWVLLHDFMDTCKLIRDEYFVAMVTTLNLLSEQYILHETLNVTPSRWNFFE